MLPNTPEYLSTVRAARKRADLMMTPVRCDPMALAPLLFGTGSVVAMFAYLGWMWFKELSA